MTKEEAKKMLTNTKVYVNGKSKEIQEKLFEIGFKWSEGSGQNVSFIIAPFLFIKKDIFYSFNMQTFKEESEKEVSPDDILNIKIDEKIKKEHEFKPFDKVLVRDFGEDNWDIDFFQEIGGEDIGYQFICLAAKWNFCIPYEGNEHLLGTSNSPEE